MQRPLHHPLHHPLHYDVSGTGEPVVLVHGITESGESWAPIVARLSATHRVLVVDLPGHGRSPGSEAYDVVTMAGAVADTVASEGLGPVRFVGHSLGGVVVSAVAASGFPTHSVVNIDQPLKLDDFQDTLKAAAPALRDPTTFPAVMNAIFEDMTGEMLDASERDRIRAVRRPDQDVVLGVWSAVLDSSPEALAAQVATLAGTIGCPYLAVHGIDPGPAYAAWLTGLVPSATVEVWEGFGHYPHLVDPDRFVRRLDEFWADG